MASPFDKQQTLETFRANQDLQQVLWDKSEVTYEKSKALDRAEKTRRFKLSLIRGWREKRKGE